MDIIETWTGEQACRLQSACRDTNEEFAQRLGVGVRTVATWHSDQGIVPRLEMQRALDTAYEQAGDAVQARFRRLSRPTAGHVQALRVAIAIVVHDERVLLVCRRGDGDLSWQFPAGVVKPGASAEAVTVQETHAETGVHCSVRQHLGGRLHPTTGVMADYHLCDYLMGDAHNRDAVENADVQWVPIGALTKFIPADRIYPPIMAALKETA